MEGVQAYGAGKAGGAFDPVTFFQQPQTILRIVSWVSEGGRDWSTNGEEKQQQQQQLNDVNACAYMICEMKT